MNLLKFADTAMYQAKEQGRNTYTVYTPAMEIAARRWADMVAALHKALENNEFSVVYQPKLSLHDERLCGVEALLRWHSAEFGDIGPAHFIPLAEQTGIIIEIGDFVLRTACAQIRQWQELGLGDIPIAVNVSVLQLLRGELASRIGRMLAEYAVKPELIQLELTESVLMAQAEQAVATLDELKAIGVGLAIDDFGTGYSSLSYLKRLPIDTLKIDRAFVRDITTDPDDRAITATIIHMAQSLELTVVAEGVETLEQYQYLREQGCHQIQGDWLSPPLPPEACTALLRNSLRNSRREIVS
jgi:EAL domain-containing protein (putative c-di-GMP-specific phosphodiesterase class I)